MGGGKNWIKCFISPAAYKLVHLYTNLKTKPLNQNLIKPSKIKNFTNLSYQTPISHQISSNPTKISTFTHHTPQSKSTIQTTFFLYKYENPNKIRLLPIYKLHAKFYNNINISISIIIKTILNICRPQ